MSDHDWTCQYIYNPDARLQSQRLQHSNHGERSEDQARPSSRPCLPVGFPQPGGRVVLPPVARVLTVSTSQGTTSQSSVSTSHGTTSSHLSAGTSQGATSMPMVRTVRGTTTSMSSGPLHGGGCRTRQRRRRRPRCHKRIGNDLLKRKTKFEKVVGPREQQMTVKIPLLGSSRPAVASGSRGAQCHISDCSRDRLKRHAFECHLPTIFKEERLGQEITIRHIGALSMIAPWHLGDWATLRSLANFFHLMDAGTTFDQSVTQGQHHTMSDMCIEIGTNPPLSFVLSHAGNEEWVLVHWQVLLRLLTRDQPLASTTACFVSSDSGERSSTSKSTISLR